MGYSPWGHKASDTTEHLTLSLLGNTSAISQHGRWIPGCEWRGPLMGGENCKLYAGFQLCGGLVPQSPCCSRVHSIVWLSLSPFSLLFSLHALLLQHQTRKGKRNRGEFPKSNVSSFLISPRVLAGNLFYPQATYQGDYPR